MRLTTLKRVRLEQGKLQFDVARAVRIAPPRLSLIENGHVAPRADELTRLAHVYGVPAEGLIDRSEHAAA